MTEATVPKPKTRRRPWGLFLLLAVMVALGLWSSKPPPPRPVDAPQPLLQVYRGGVPRDLLLALPLQPTDEVRVVAEVPSDLFFSFFWVEPDGRLRQLQPLSRRQSGKLQELAFPELKPMPLSGAKGTHLALVVGARNQPPAAEEVVRCVGTEPMPPLPTGILALLAPRGLELTGPKGPKLPPAEQTQALEARLKLAADRLRGDYPFFLAAAVTCE